MKKTIAVLLCLAAILAAVSGCSNEYKGWQTVSIKNCGKIKVPGEWEVTEKDGFVFLTDKPLSEENYKIHIAQVAIEYDVYSEVSKTEENPFFQDMGMKYVKEISEEKITDNTTLFKNIYSIDEEEQDFFLLIAENGKNSVMLLSMDNLLDETVITGILKSFEAEQNDVKG